MKLVRFLYGHDYSRLLSEELMVIKNHKGLIWGIALSLNLIVVVLTLMLWPLNECFHYFTDLTMWLTLALTILL